MRPCTPNPSRTTSHGPNPNPTCPNNYSHEGESHGRVTVRVRVRVRVRRAERGVRPRVHGVNAHDAMRSCGELSTLNYINMNIYSHDGAYMRGTVRVRG